jgi:hypothetical protein
MQGAKTRIEAKWQLLNLSGFMLWRNAAGWPSGILDTRGSQLATVVLRRRSPLQIVLVAGQAFENRIPLQLVCSDIVLPVRVRHG